MESHLKCNEVHQAYQEIWTDKPIGRKTEQQESQPGAIVTVKRSMSLRDRLRRQIRSEPELCGKTGLHTPSKPFWVCVCRRCRGSRPLHP
jgi:hypothetical protein